MTEILPDSRLRHAPTLGSQVVDWQLPGGGTVRIEVVPMYCANCGHGGPFVPMENTASCFYLCNHCVDTCGPIANTMILSDQEFNELVAYEMVERFGHGLNPEQIALAVDQGQLGRPLEALLNDSPYLSR